MSDYQRLREKDKEIERLTALLDAEMESNKSLCERELALATDNERLRAELLEMKSGRLAQALRDLPEVKKAFADNERLRAFLICYRSTLAGTALVNFERFCNKHGEALAAVTDEAADG